jgi:tripartite-type tricarboxylate transporter receptor subunit TctC
MRALLTLVFLVAASMAHAQTYPSRPVKLVVAFPPGGATDVTARILANKLAQKWRQPVIVENRPGAAANIGTAQVARSEPDGYTLLLATTALSISPSTFKALSYDALKDLAPVTMVTNIPNVLVVSPEFPAKDIGEFIARVRAQPGRFNFAAPGAASGQRLTFELIKQTTGIDIVMVAFAGGGPALQAVIGGHVQAMIVNIAEAAPLVRDGKLRALAITTARRSPMLPEVPSLAETVAPGVDTSVWQALFAPAGTPDAIVNQLARDVTEVLAMPDIKQQLSAMGMDVVPGTPEALGRFLREDIDTWRRVGNAAKLQPE